MVEGKVFTDKFRDQTLSELFSFCWLLKFTIISIKKKFWWQSGNDKEWIKIFVDFINV